MPQMNTRDAYFESLVSGYNYWEKLVAYKWFKIQRPLLFGGVNVTSELSNRLIDKVVFDQEKFHVYSQNLCYFLEGIHWFLQHGNKRNFHVLWTFQVAYYNIHTTKDSLAPLFYLQQCSSRWANPPCYRVIELLMDFVSSYQKRNQANLSD